MTDPDQLTFAERYTMRSRFFQLLGEAGKALALAYREADRENQRDIRRLVGDAMVHSLVEHHRYPIDEIVRPLSVDGADFVEAMSTLNPTIGQYTRECMEWDDSKGSIRAQAAAFETAATTARGWAIGRFGAP